MAELTFTPVPEIGQNEPLRVGKPKINQTIRNSNETTRDLTSAKNGYPDLTSRLSNSDKNLITNPSFSAIPEYYEKASSITLVLTTSGRLGTRIDSATYVTGDCVKYKLLRNVNPNEDITVSFLANVFSSTCRVRFKVSNGSWSEWEKIANTAGVDTWFKKTFNVGDFPVANANNWLWIEFDKSLDIAQNTLVVAKGFDFSLSAYEAVKKQAVNIDLLPEQLHGVQFNNLFNPAERTLNQYLTDAGFINASAIIDTSRLIKVSPGEIIGSNYSYANPGGFFDHNGKWARKINFTETSAGSGWFTDTVPNNASFVLVNVVKSNLNTYMLNKTSIKPIRYYPFGANSRVIVNSKWTGKIVAWVGDSITEKNFRANKNYHDFIAEKTGMIVVNHGKSGTGYATPYGQSSPIKDRVKDIDTNTDLIVIFAGTNDFGNGTLPLGSITDKDGTVSVTGAIYSTFEQLVNRFPTKVIAIMTPLPRSDGNNFNPVVKPNGIKLEDLVNRIKEMAAMFSFPCLDLYHNSNLPVWNTEANNYYFTSPGGTNPDGLHPNDKGQEKMGEKIGPWLETL
ncbi:hypothetical protein CN449_15145 [Bacillus thuringiensis]|uniref:SGNH/GDSL hydrolase family protein n=1 Tax=Bacillus thuringiensis TaxID=1428 RepID=UPI000BFA49E4|nr:SGNH/GDSL hydrolase family protein [Bacillus thuringiensis]PEW73999.1 hypothetical protein CN449_15145 [Bacillus thuringiensis]PFD32563.1 hypothetical protein CN269_04440 [Bacillus thuringiensis]